MKKLLSCFVILCLLSQASWAADVVLFGGQSNGQYLDANAFKAKYLQLTGQNVNVINCAQGNTYILQHVQEYATASMGTPSVICRMEAQKQKGLGNNVIGVIWWQGENDSIINSARPAPYTNTWYSDWLRHFQSVQRILREGLNQPNLPFVLIKLPVAPSVPCRVATIDYPTYWETIRLFQEAAAIIQPSTALVNLDAAGIQYNCVDVHLTGQPGKYALVSELSAAKFVEKFGI